MRSTQRTLLVAAALSGLLFVLYVALVREAGPTALPPAAPAEAVAQPLEEVSPPLEPPLEVALEPETTAELEQREPVSGEREDRSAGRLAPEDSTWITGSIVFPDGLPADEELFVLSLDRRRTAEGLYGRRAIADPVRDPAIQREPLLAWSPVAPDGRFRVAAPAAAESAHLALAGRYLYSTVTTQVPLPAPPQGVRLTGELGGWITGRLVPPPDASGGELLFEGVEVELGPDVTGGFDAMTIGEFAYTQLDRADADGRFEFRAVPGLLAHGLAVKHEVLAATVELGLRHAPGEHLEVEVPFVRGATIEGTVVDTQGAPVHGALVAARLPGALGAALEDLRVTNADERGAFVLANVTPARLELQARREGYRTARQKLAQELHDGQVFRGVELVLDRGGTVAGRVTFPDGAPAELAEVRLSADLAAMTSAFAGSNFDPEDGGSAVTDADGRFSISGLGKTIFKVVARRTPLDEDERSDAWVAHAGNVRAGDAPLELVLAREAALRGQVVDEAGEALSAFVVKAMLAGSGGLMGIGAEKGRWSFEDREEGRFEVEGLRPGEWLFSVAAEGRATSAELALELPRPEDAEPVVFVLRPGARVTGRVLGPSGETIPGARVTLELDLAGRVAAQQGEGPPDTLSDVEGRFELAIVEPGTLSLVASHEGFARSTPVPCEVAPGETVADLVLSLRNGGSLSGVVYDDEGEPDEGRMIIVQLVPTYASQHMLTSDRRGEFTVDHLEPGQWQVVATANFLTGEVEPTGDEAEAMSDLLSNMEFEMVTIVDGEETHVVLGELPEDPVRIVGRILHAREPVPNVMVSFAPEGMTDLGDLVIAFTDENGSFEAQLAQRGPTLVTAQHDVAAGRQNSIEYLVEIPAAVSEHELVLEQPLGRIAGRVEDSEGRPLAGCRVTLNVEGGVVHGSFLGGHYTETRTDENGDYAIPYLRPGVYAVAAGGSPLGGLLGDDPQGGRAVRSGLRIGPEESLDRVDFRLGASCELTGTVTRPAGSPAAEATIFLRDEEGRLLERFSLITTDGAGRYSYRGLAPGKYTVCAMLAELVSAESDPVRVRAGEAAEADVTLLPGTVLVVTVVDEGEARERARISVVDEQGREYAGMLSLTELMKVLGQGFSSKEQRIGPVPPGKYTVTASFEDGRTKRKTVRVEGRPELNVKLRLR